MVLLVLEALLARGLPIEALVDPRRWWPGTHWGARLAESAQRRSWLACLDHFGEAAGVP